MARGGCTGLAGTSFLPRRCTIASLEHHRGQCTILGGSSSRSERSRQRSFGTQSQAPSRSPSGPDPLTRRACLVLSLAHVAFEVREFTPRFSTDMNFVASNRPLGRLRSSPEVEDGEETGGKTIQSHDVLFFFPRRDFGGEFRKVFCCDLRLGWVGLAVLVLRWPEPAGPSRALEVAWEQAITSSMTCFERDSEREVWLRAKG